MDQALPTLWRSCGLSDFCSPSFRRGLRYRTFRVQGHTGSQQRTVDVLGHQPHPFLSAKCLFVLVHEDKKTSRHSWCKMTARFSQPLCINGCVAPLSRTLPSALGFGGAETGQILYRIDVHPHDGLRPFHEKSTCLKQMTLGPYVVESWSLTPQTWGERNPRSPPCGPG